MSGRSIAVALVVAGVGAAGFAASRQEARVGYPEGYRSWAHVKSMVILPGHPLEDPFGGIHHVYANDRALEGLRTGAYADGAVFVFDLLEAVSGEGVVEEGPRKLVGVMERDARRFAATGGWGFEGFAGDSRTERLVKDGGRSCFGCHEAAQATGYVFSRWRP